MFYLIYILIDIHPLGVNRYKIQTRQNKIICEFYWIHCISTRRHRGFKAVPASLGPQIIGVRLVLTSLWLNEAIWRHKTCQHGYGTKPLSEPMLTNHQWGRVTFTWHQFPQRYLSHQSLNLVWNLYKIIQNFTLISHGLMSLTVTPLKFGNGSIISPHTRPFPKFNFNGSWGMDKYFHPTLYNGCKYLFMLGLKSTHVSKRGHSTSRK